MFKIGDKVRTKTKEPFASIIKIGEIATIHKLYDDGQIIIMIDKYKMIQICRADNIEHIIDN